MAVSPKQWPCVNTPTSFAFGVGELLWNVGRSYRIDPVRSTRCNLICFDKHRYVYGVDALWFQCTHQINRRHTLFWLHADDVHVKQETQEWANGKHKLACASGKLLELIWSSSPAARGANSET